MRRATRVLSAGLALVATLLTSAGPAAADSPNLEMRGLLDVGFATRGAGLEANWFNAGATSFDAYRFRFFVEGAATKRIYVYTQLILDEILTHPVYGAYVMFTPWTERDAHVMVGKMPWIIGTYGPRTYSDRKPLIGTPLIYQYHTTLRYDAIPPNADALLAVAGRGQYGVQYGSATNRFRGMPVIYDFCWDAGLAVTGSQSGFEYAVGMINGTPGWMTPAQDNNNGKSALGRIGIQPIPMLRAGVSASYGPYLNASLDPQLPPGKTASDYQQKLLMADLSIETGHIELRGEGYVNRWMTPTVGDLDVTGYYAEGKLGLPAGTWVAARWEQMMYSDLTGSSGVPQPWNDDFDRLETGVGLRFARGAVVKAVYQANWQHHLDETRVHELWATQLSVSF